MAISKIILNGVTQIDLTQDTVAANNLVSPNTAHGADGTQVTGTLVPVDCPVFTIVIDSIYGTLVSITCNKTFSECVNYTSGSDSSYLHNEAIAKKYNNNNQFIQSFGLSGGYDQDNQGSFVMYGTIGLDDVYSIRYNEDGTFQLVSTWTDLYPIATKGAVTNHSISVTPSAHQQAWGFGKWYTGTPVTVSASELVSGSETKTANGTYDVTNLAELVVNVPSSSSSKNAQIVQDTTRTNSSTATAIGAELTVSKSGTYDIYWSGFRTNTSASYTWGTQLYIDGTAHSSENTTWTNNQQNNHLTNISLTTGQKLRVYGRETRGASYYVCAPTLAIVEQ